MAKKRATVKKSCKKRKQRGGMFGMYNVMNEWMKPIQDIAPRVVGTGMQIAKDVQGGKNWKESVLTRIPDTLKQAVAGKPFQLGSGLRRRRIPKKKKKKKKHGIHS